MTRAIVLALVFLSAVAAPAAAREPIGPDWVVAQSDLCGDAIALAEAKHDIPPGIMEAIGKVESGRPITSATDIRAWPWTIDANGTGLYLDSKQAALVWVRQAQARHVPFIDVGCMQIDLQMHPAAFASLETAFDPVTNADYAASYLRALYQEAGGNWNVAVGLYHSHTPDLAAGYRNQVAMVGAGIVTGVGAPMPMYQRVIRQGAVRLALAGGGVLQINVNRQPTGRRPHRLPSCEVAALLAPLMHRPPKLTGCEVARR